jgi:F0F1-type ATP synthase membrane subunit a
MITFSILIGIFSPAAVLVLFTLAFRYFSRRSNSLFCLAVKEAYVGLRNFLHEECEGDAKLYISGYLMPFALYIITLTLLSLIPIFKSPLSNPVDLAAFFIAHFLVMILAVVQRNSVMQAFGHGLSFPMNCVFALLEFCTTLMRFMVFAVRFFLHEIETMVLFSAIKCLTFFFRLFIAIVAIPFGLALAAFQIYIILILTCAYFSMMLEHDEE